MPLYFRNVVYFVAILLVYTQYFYTLMLILDGICQIFEKIRNEIPPPPKSPLFSDELIRYFSKPSFTV